MARNETTSGAATGNERPAGQPADATVLAGLLDTLFAPWVRDLGLSLRSVHEDGVTLSMPIAPATVHAGGVVCGQALMAAADTALVLAASRVLGGFRPLTTVQLQSSFLRPVASAAGSLDVEARILKRGRTLLFGEVHLRLADGSLAAHVTSTSTLL